MWRHYYITLAAILGSEYCSGYIDSVGKWNTGFYCPEAGARREAFCCGTPHHKYCCTSRDTGVGAEVAVEEVASVPVVVGVLVGAATALLLALLLLCVCCPRRTADTKHRLQDSKGGDTRHYLLRVKK